MIMDISVWNYIPVPDNKFLFWTAMAICWILIVLIDDPACIAGGPPSYIHDDPVSYAALRNDWLKEISYVAGFCILGLTVMIFLSPIWYKDNPRKLALYIYTSISFVILYLLSYPELICGYMDPELLAPAMPDSDEILSWKKSKKTVRIVAVAALIFFWIVTFLVLNKNSKAKQSEHDTAATQ